MANGEWVRWIVQTTSTKPCLDKNFATPITWNTIPLCYHAVIITSSSKQYDFMSLFSLFPYVCVWQYETLTAPWHTEVINNWSCMKQDVLGSSSSCNACLERSDCLPPSQSIKNTVWDLEVDVYLFVSLQKPQQNWCDIHKQHKLFTLFCLQH